MKKHKISKFFHVGFRALALHAGAILMLANINWFDSIVTHPLEKIDCALSTHCREAVSRKNAITHYAQADINFATKLLAFKDIANIELIVKTRGSDMELDLASYVAKNMQLMGLMDGQTLQDFKKASLGQLNALTFNHFNKPRFLVLGEDLLSKKEFLSIILNQSLYTQQQTVSFIVFHEIGHIFAKDPKHQQLILDIIQKMQEAAQLRFSSFDRHIITSQFQETMSDAIGLQLFKLRYPHLSFNDAIDSLAYNRLAHITDMEHFSAPGVIYLKNAATLDGILSNALEAAKINLQAYSGQTYDRSYSPEDLKKRVNAQAAHIVPLDKQELDTRLALLVKKHEAKMQEQFSRRQQAMQASYQH